MQVQDPITSHRKACKVVKRIHSKAAYVRILFVIKRKRYTSNHFQSTDTAQRRILRQYNTVAWISIVAQPHPYDTSLSLSLTN